jgi:hypothetical protein
MAMTEDMQALIDNAEAQLRSGHAVADVLARFAQAVEESVLAHLVDANAVAERFGVTPRQARTWLERLGTEEGKARVLHGWYMGPLAAEHWFEEIGNRNANRPRTVDRRALLFPHSSNGTMVVDRPAY